MPSTSPPTSSPTAWPRNASRAVPDLRRKRRSNGRSVQAVAQMRPQADDADQDQVDRDEVVERARDQLPRRDLPDPGRHHRPVAASEPRPALSGRYSAAFAASPAPRAMRSSAMRSAM